MVFNHKKVFVTLLLMISILLATLVTVKAQDVNVYRLYNPNTGEHLYTTDQSEVSNLAEKAGWNDEGRGWIAPAAGNPIYRLFSPAISDHLYTQDLNEISELIAQHGWVSDFNGQPIFYSGGSKAVYRLYNPSNGRHHLTTDEFEYNVLANIGWSPEGVALYALEDSSAEPETPEPSTPESSTPEDKPISVTEVQVTPSTLTLKAGEEHQLEATVLPENAANKEIKWTTSDPYIALVEPTGLVHPREAGTVTVYATSRDGNKEGKCEITIQDADPVDVNQITGISYGPRHNGNQPLTSWRGSVGSTMPWNELFSDAFFMVAPERIYISTKENPEYYDFFALPDFENQIEKIYTFETDDPGIVDYNPGTKEFIIKGKGTALINLATLGDNPVRSHEINTSELAAFMAITTD